METREEILEALIERIAQITGKDAETITEDTPFEELNLKSVNISHGMKTDLFQSCSHCSVFQIC